MLQNKNIEKESYSDFICVFISLVYGSTNCVVKLNEIEETKQKVPTK